MTKPRSECACPWPGSGESVKARQYVRGPGRRPPSLSCSGNLSRSSGQTLFGEEAVGRDVGEMAETSDEEQALAGAFGLGLEARPDRRRSRSPRSARAEHCRILLRHHDDAREAPHRGGLEAAPAERVPPRGEGTFAPGNLLKRSKVTSCSTRMSPPILGELRVFHLQGSIAEAPALSSAKACRMAGERNSWTSGGSRVLPARLAITRLFDR